MNVTLIGMGSGQPENLTLQGLACLLYTSDAADD